ASGRPIIPTQTIWDIFSVLPVICNINRTLLAHLKEHLEVVEGGEGALERSRTDEWDSSLHQAALVASPRRHSDNEPSRDDDGSGHAAQSTSGDRGEGVASPSPRRPSRI